MNQRSPITTHVLDLGKGRAAQGIPAILERREASGEWKELARGVTDADGRIETLLPANGTVMPGVFRLTFSTASYNSGGFFPEVTIAFEVRDGRQHHHVPLLLSPFGYSTYRGT